MSVSPIWSRAGKRCRELASWIDQSSIREPNGDFRAQVAQQDRVFGLWLEVELIGGYGRVGKHPSRHVALGPAPQLERPPAMGESLALCSATDEDPEHQTGSLRSRAYTKMLVSRKCAVDHPTRMRLPSSNARHCFFSGDAHSVNALATHR